ncbi:hypothetical protein D0C36_23170 [Mucilaginibacter conchicola]|uniref:Lipocalin-like domain-containing protein n=1 Tax=Mucilaginibacter conchicola TaxID=2303333 RepID=A0A372NMI0_9SPHI|nr:hypothetical protein [Mucilaginibacter conchicola]RFZ90144.1 hypothetical protein D0C36_23170 [Mucilaginibacter conchicola]
MIKNLQINISVKALFFALALLIFSACKKSNDGDSTVAASITVNVDGKAKKFDRGASAITLVYNSEQSATTITGTADDGAILSITISGKLVTGKTYSNTAAQNIDKPVIMYSIGDVSYYSYFSGLQTFGSVTITSATETSVKGTFDCDMLEYIPGLGNNIGKGKKNMTNGKFSVKLTSQSAQ